MIRYSTGNLLDADVEALVNTVNTVGVMGKGIALMFKERFPNNNKEYELACKQGEVRTGKVFVTSSNELMGPRWIINFPTKQHWRSNSKVEWIDQGLEDLHAFLIDNQVRSVAIPPLGAGNGGLKWLDVKPRIEAVLADLENVDIVIYEPVEKYQNVAKKRGVEALTAPRALIAELVRRYAVLGMECSLLEIQKLAWFLQRGLDKNGIKHTLNLDFQPKNYGPYAHNLDKLLDALDGSYLQADKRISDAKPSDLIRFNDDKKLKVQTYLKTEAQPFLPALEEVTALIEGFESPFGMELLSTVDWLVSEQGCQATMEGVKGGVAAWPAGAKWAQRKQKLFDDRSISLALERLSGQVAKTA